MEVNNILISPDFSFHWFIYGVHTHIRMYRMYNYISLLIWLITDIASINALFVCAYAHHMNKKYTTIMYWKGHVSTRCAFLWLKLHWSLNTIRSTHILAVGYMTSVLMWFWINFWRNLFSNLRPRRISQSFFVVIHRCFDM